MKHSFPRKFAILACVFLFMVSPISLASSPALDASSVPLSRYNYINSIFIDLVIINSKANISTQVVARNCTSIRQDIVLQYRANSSSS